MQMPKSSTSGSTAKEKFMRKVGRNLLKYRMLRKLTQKELGGLTGIADSQVYLYETGQRLPSVPNLAKLCKHLGVTSDKIIGI